MTARLFFEAIVKFSFGVVLVGLLVFLPAGTLFFLNGWIFNGGLVYSDVFCRDSYAYKKTNTFKIQIGC